MTNMGMRALKPLPLIVHYTPSIKTASSRGMTMLVTKRVRISYPRGKGFISLG